MLAMRFVVAIASVVAVWVFPFAAVPCEIGTKESVSLHREGKQAVFVITSERGIGKATIRLNPDRWLQDVVLRFQYQEGSGFEMLESLGITTDCFQISWTPSRDKDDLYQWGEQRMGFYLANAEGKFVQDGSVTGYLIAKVEKTKQGIEVRLPAGLFTGSKEVTISWIDAFRR
jgi:hypothetical protein